MNDQIPYTFAVLRYSHDLATGERVNVGVALFAPKARFIGVLCSSRTDRVALIFPGVNREALNSALSAIQFGFKSLASRLATERSSAYEQKNVLDLARTVLPRDDSSLQWDAYGGGLTTDPEFELRRLFERMVQRYEVNASSSKALPQLSGVVPPQQVSGPDAGLTIFSYGVGQGNAFVSADPNHLNWLGCGLTVTTSGIQTFSTGSGQAFAEQTAPNGAMLVGAPLGLQASTTSFGSISVSGYTVWNADTVSVSGGTISSSALVPTHASISNVYGSSLVTSVQNEQGADLLPENFSNGSR